MNIELRDYQLRHIKAIRDALKSGHRKLLIVAPTGAGKATIAAYITKMAVDKGSRVFFYVHKRELVHNFVGRLKSQFGLESGIIMAGEKKLLALFRPAVYKPWQDERNIQRRIFCMWMRHIG